jgi:hypothetical protein
MSRAANNRPSRLATADASPDTDTNGTPLHPSLSGPDGYGLQSAGLGRHSHGVLPLRNGMGSAAGCSGSFAASRSLRTRVRTVNANGLTIRVPSGSVDTTRSVPGFLPVVRPSIRNSRIGTPSAPRNSMVARGAFQFRKTFREVYQK